MGKHNKASASLLAGAVCVVANHWLKDYGFTVEELGGIQLIVQALAAWIVPNIPALSPAEGGA